MAKIKTTSQLGESFVLLGERFLQILKFRTLSKNLDLILNSKESDDYEPMVQSFANVFLCVCVCVTNDEARCFRFPCTVWGKEKEGKMYIFSILHN